MKKTILSAWAILLIFVYIALLKQNWEFLFYSATIAVLLWVIMSSDKKFNYPKVALLGLNAWLLIHLLGGMAKIGKTRLYDFILINLIGDPYYILKYDQFVHLFCYFVAAFFIYTILKNISKKETNWYALAFLTVIPSIGIGGLNEVIEFSTVVVLKETGVGGYTNTAIDLVANTLGAIIALPFLEKKKK